MKVYLVLISTKEHIAFKKKKKTLHALAYTATFKKCNECIISSHNEEVLKELSHSNHENKFM